MFFMFFRKLLHELINEKTIKLVKKCDQDELKAEHEKVKEAMEYEEPSEDLPEDEL